MSTTETHTQDPCTALLVVERSIRLATNRSEQLRDRAELHRLRELCGNVTPALS